MLGFKGSASAAREVNLGNPLHTGKKASTQGIHLGLETQGWHHRKSKTGVPVVPQKDWCPPKEFFEKSANVVSILILFPPVFVWLQWKVDPYQKWREKCFSALDFILFVYPAKLDEEGDFTNPLHDILLFSSGTIWVNMPGPVSFSRNSGFHFILEISRKTVFRFFKPGKKPSHYLDIYEFYFSLLKEFFILLAASI